MGVWDGNYPQRNFHFDLSPRSRLSLEGRFSFRPSLGDTRLGDVPTGRFFPWVCCVFFKNSLRVRQVEVSRGPIPGVLFKGFPQKSRPSFRQKSRPSFRRHSRQG